MSKRPPLWVQWQFKYGFKWSWTKIPVTWWINSLNTRERGELYDWIHSEIKNDLKEQ